MLADPRVEALRRALGARTPATLTRETGEREAAVTLIVRPREQLELLLIKRAVRETDPWSGQMALPGGRRGPEDADLLDTALRETAEETGVDVACYGRVIGALDEIAPRNRRLPPIVIAPFVAAVPPGTLAVADGHEVETTLWIPVPALRDDAAVSEILIELQEEGSRSFPSLVYQEHVIWGLTHRILTQFMEVLGAADL
jgi:8-oxo-dGTP pyrophosphatase MutT (NUDIX family)